jgi:hypothetical protein
MKGVKGAGSLALGKGVLLPDASGCELRAENKQV